MIDERRTLDPMIDEHETRIRDDATDPEGWQ